jgi:hypothetical protein
MRALDEMTEVETTSIFGTAVHAVLNSRAPDAADRLRSQLSDRGLAVSSIEPVQPSLEDVFLEVVTEAA